MLETSRRSGISTSELGLYSDRSDRYNRSRYGLIVRKFAIGVMIVVTVILVAIFTYDFTSATSVNSKINKETKHIYILQNALKKSPYLGKKPANSTIMSKAMVHHTDTFYMEDRSDDEKYDDFMQTNATSDVMMDEPSMLGGPEMRAQNLHNFKHRKRVLKSVEDARENEEAEAKQLFDNHAIVYRVKQRYKHSNLDEDMNTEETQPMPFHWKLKTPHPASFKRPRYPQLSQYRYPHSSRSIQDIIKYLTNNSEMPKRGIKFTGVYMNPKKYDLIPAMGELMSNSDKSESEEMSPFSIKSQQNDPFYRYKPKHPADVNLLATSNVRFSPTGVHRYSPYYDPLYSQPLFSYNKPMMIDSQYENTGSYSTSTLAKNRKPKPFSVMLDIYPITDIVEQNNKKTSRPRPQGSMDDYNSRRPLPYVRVPKYHASSPQPIPLIAIPSPTSLSEEEEKQQMIFHLNLYPRKKSKLNRHDIIHRSQMMGTQERQQFMKKLTSPLEMIAKQLTDHSAIEEAKFEENKKSETTSMPITRYHEMNLNEKQEKEGAFVLNNDSEIYSDLDNDEDAIVFSNHKLSLDEDYASTEKYEINAQKLIMTTEENLMNRDNATMIDSSKANENKSADLSKDIDTTEGF